MAFGIGGAIKKLGRDIEKSVRKGGKSTSRAVSKIGAEAKRVGDRGVVGQAKRNVQRKISNALPGEEAEEVLPEEVAMPIPDEALSMVARRRARARRRGGRGSSILSESETLG